MKGQYSSFWNDVKRKPPDSPNSYSFVQTTTLPIKGQDWWTKWNHVRSDVHVALDSVKRCILRIRPNKGKFTVYRESSPPEVEANFKFTSK